MSSSSSSSSSSGSGSEARSLEDWDTWIDRAIREAQRRGEFDNLPGAGKPLTVDDNPFAGELGTAFGILKNAGMAPPWIELDKEVRAAETALNELRDRAARRAHERLTPITPEHTASGTTTPQTPADDGRKRRWPFGFGRTNARPRQEPASPTVDRLAAERERARREYLDRTAKLDAKIAEYNAFLPEALRWRQRPRLTAEQAGRVFDAAWPPDSSEAPQA